MSFIRTVKVKGHEYLAEVESYRDGDKVRQRYIRYIGPKGSSRGLVTTSGKPVTGGSKLSPARGKRLDFDSSDSIMLNRRYPTLGIGVGIREIKVGAAAPTPKRKPRIKAQKAKPRKLVTTPKAEGRELYQEDSTGGYLRNVDTGEIREVYTPPKKAQRAKPEFDARVLIRQADAEQAKAFDKLVTTQKEPL